MPHVMPTQKKSAAAEPPDEASRQPSLSNAPAAGLDNPAPRPAKKGVLFRALVKAGCDSDAAYNAEVEVASMAAENVIAQLGAQVQLGFVEVKQLCKENAERLAEHGEKLEVLTAAGIERDKKVEGLAVEVGGLKKELTAEVSGLRKEFTAEVSGLKEVLTAEMSGLRKEFTAELSGLRKELTAEVSGLRKEFTAEVGGLRKEFIGEMGGLRKEFIAEMGGLKKEFIAEMGGLKEVSAARTDALRMELRLVWGALGLLVTVLLAVFGFLFMR